MQQVHRLDEVRITERRQETMRLRAIDSGLAAQSGRLQVTLGNHKHWSLECYLPPVYAEPSAVRLAQWAGERDKSRVEDLHRGQENVIISDVGSCIGMGA